jgi:hypothetical protein
MKTPITLFILALLVVGCGGSEPQTQDTSVPSDNDEPTLREAIEEAGVEIDPVLREFMIHEENRAKEDYTVHYTVKMTNNGEQMDSTMAEFHAADGRVRRDTALEGFGESRTFELGDDYISCNKMGSSWSCTKSTYTESTVEETDSQEESTDVETYDPEEVEEGKVERDGQETVAGQTAQCYKLTMGSFVGRECRSKEGVMLLTTGRDAEGGTSEIRATSYKASVSASDFEPPAMPVVAGSPEAQAADCQAACDMLELSASECSDMCANQQQYN